MASEKLIQTAMILLPCTNYVFPVKDYIGI